MPRLFFICKLTQFKKMKKLINVGLVLTVLLGMVALSIKAQTLELVGYWPLDDGPGTTSDQSGNGNDGTAYGATFAAGGGVTGGTYHFDGVNDYIQVADSSVLNPSTGSVTIETWVYPRALPSSDNQSMLLDKFWWQGSGYGIWLNQQGAINWNAGTRATQTGSGVIQLNKWQHIAMVADGSTDLTTLYYNGVAVTTIQWNGSLEAYAPHSRTKNLWIGAEQRANPWEYPNYFKGYIDEVRIYARAKTAVEIEADAKTFRGPNGGFVTGGGWINSPEGAYAADPTLTGRANFGFNSKYKNGANIPDGQTEFNFKAGDFNFHSSSYEWLVVAGTKANYKGVGTINGVGNYGFMLTADDASPDTFRIKIWDKDDGDAVVYDNQMDASDDSYAGTAIGGGNIVVR